MRSFAIALACVFVGCATAEQIVDEDTGTPTPDAGTPDVGKTCSGATKLCGNTCTDVNKDPNNCGMCGMKCPAGNFCSAGKCMANCMPPTKLCGQFCVDTTSDHDNCGACGKGCTVDQQCVNSGCVKKCAPGLMVCDMDCVDTKTDPMHCGDCSTSCAMNEICTGSLCCKQGETACNGTCTNTQGDPNNCGQCGFACGGNTPYCIQGKCGNSSGGEVRDVNKNWAPAIFVKCGNGTNTNCTEPVAESSCTAIGKKLVAHASNGSNGVVSLGAVTSCYWDISYFKNLDPNVAGQCLIGVSNAKWSSCCGMGSWHGNIVTVPQQLNTVFGYVNSTDSGYDAQLPNVTGTTWGCQGENQAPPARQGCNTYYVACK